jgi:hypothetical protein
MGTAKSQRVNNGAQVATYHPPALIRWQTLYLIHHHSIQEIYVIYHLYISQLYACSQIY